MDGAARDDSDFTVIGWLSRGDFATARLRAPDFAGTRDYAQFSTERDAQRLSLATAGVPTQAQDVPFAPFARWSELTGAALDLNGLDEFAAHWRWREARPFAPVRGWIGAPGLGEGGPVAVGGVQWIVFRAEAFLDWRRASTGSPTFEPAGLDRYATQVVESCLPSAPRAARSAASSA